jgi:hypothetical protein
MTELTMSGPPDAPTTARRRPSYSTIVGDMLLSGFLPAATARRPSFAAFRASPGTSSAEKVRWQYEAHNMPCGMVETAQMALQASLFLQCRHWLWFCVPR